MTSNYRDTFIAVAPDCPASAAEAPPMNAVKPTVAAIQYQLLIDSPYVHTSDEVLFAVHAQRAGISPEQWDTERDRFLAKEQPCLRASPLGKRYGWGTHHDEQGRVALVPIGSPEYERMIASTELVQKSAMRSSRAR